VVKTKKVSSVSKITETMFGIVTSRLKNLTKQNHPFYSNKKAPVSFLTIWGFFHLSDTDGRFYFAITFMLL